MPKRSVSPTPATRADNTYASACSKPGAWLLHARSKHPACNCELAVAHLGVVLDEVRVVVVGLGHERHEGLAGLGAGGDHELGQVVQVAGVALLVVAQRQQLRLTTGPHGRLERVLAGCHPVQVALDRVNLTCTQECPTTSTQLRGGIRQGPVRRGCSVGCRRGFIFSEPCACMQGHASSKLTVPLITSVLPGDGRRQRACLLQVVDPTHGSNEEAGEAHRCAQAHAWAEPGATWGWCWWRSADGTRQSRW